MFITGIRVFVKDLQEAHDFYVNQLGFSVVATAPDFYMFNTGQAQLMIESVTDGADALVQSWIGRFTGISFEVDNIQGKYQELVEKGVVFVGLPEQQAWGGWLATFRDVSGNELQLVQNFN